MIPALEAESPRLGWPQPGELWSLWDMIEIRLRDLLEATQRLAQMRQLFMTLDSVATDEGGPSKAGVMNVQALGAVMGAAEYSIKIAKEADLDATLANAERLLDCVTAIRLTHQTTGRMPMWEEAIRDVEQHVAGTHQAIKDQLSKRSVLMLTASEAALYEPSEPLFGAVVETKFPDARDDIEEAGKCLAVARNKACVCHLMLAMEEALRVLAVRENVTIHDAQGKWLPWLKLTNNLEHQKIKKMPEGPEKVAWWEVHSMLNSVGRAWRNPTMHPAKSYDGAQARKVFEAVKGFMSDLASLV